MSPPRPEKLRSIEFRLPRVGSKMLSRLSRLSPKSISELIFWPSSFLRSSLAESGTFVIVMFSAR